LELLSRLEDVLEQQAELYDALLDLARRKREVLVGGQIGDLDRIVQSEEVLLWRAARLEGVRARVTREIAATLGLQADDPPLRVLSEGVEEPFRGTYRRLDESISRVVERLRALNRANTDLIHASLEFINWSFNLLRQAQERAAAYASDGRLAGEPAGERSRRMDTRA